MAPFLKTKPIVIISYIIVLFMVADYVSSAYARNAKSRRVQENEDELNEQNFILVDIGSYEQRAKETSESLKRTIRSALDGSTLSRHKRQFSRPSLTNPVGFSGLNGNPNTAKQSDEDGNTSGLPVPALEPAFSSGSTNGLPAPALGPAYSNGATNGSLVPGLALSLSNGLTNGTPLPLPVPNPSLLNGTNSFLNATKGLTQGLAQGVTQIATLSGLPNITLFQFANEGKLDLPKDYNRLFIPKLDKGKKGEENGTYEAVPVTVYINIKSVRDIDEEDDTVTLDVELRVDWVDGSLFDPAVSNATDKERDVLLNGEFMEKVWRPDVYFDETVKIKTTPLISLPSRFQYNPHSSMFSYITRSTVKLSCDFEYQYYPADTQECEFKLRSFLYFSKDLELKWFENGVFLEDPADPNFYLQVESTDEEKLNQTLKNTEMTDDTFDGISFRILARRKLSFHMVQTYLPSIFFIVITWLAFLVPSRMAEARVGISMTTLLTLTAMFASVRESTPIVSYVKAIDIWMVFCIFYVFMTLLEFTILMWIRYSRERADEYKLERKTQDKEPENGLNSRFTRSPSMESTNLRKYETFMELIEKYAVLIYSIIFIVFNVIYWSWLLSASGYNSWEVNEELNGELDDGDN